VFVLKDACQFIKYQKKHIVKFHVSRREFII